MEAKISNTVNVDPTLADFIGRGIDLMNAKGPYSNQLKQPVLNIEKLKNNGIIKTLPVKEGHLNYQSTDTLKEVYSNWNIDASVGIKTPFFSGDFKAEFSNTSQHVNCSKFFKGIISIKGYSHTLSTDTYKNNNALPSRDALVEYLIQNKFVSDAALSNIKNPNFNATNLFNRYGTHIIISGISGGSIQVTAQYASDTTVSEKEFSSTLKFACGYVTSESKGGFSDKQKAVLNNVELNATSRGGDPRIIGTLHNFESIPKVFEQWANTVVSENYVMTDITAAIPIWEFCDDSERLHQLESAYEKTSNKIFQEIENYYPTPSLNEQVTIHVHKLKLNQDVNNFVIATMDSPLLLEKEYVAPEIYRFKLVNSTRPNSYLCLAENGPFGSYINLSFTGSKENRYTHFYLKPTGKTKNSYMMRSVMKGHYVRDYFHHNVPYLVCAGLGNGISCEIYPQK